MRVCAVPAEAELLLVAPQDRWPCPHHRLGQHVVEDHHLGREGGGGGRGGGGGGRGWEGGREGDVGRGRKREGGGEGGRRRGGRRREGEGHHSHNTPQPHGLIPKPHVKHGIWTITRVMAVDHEIHVHVHVQYMDTTSGRHSLGQLAQWCWGDSLTPSTPHLTAFDLCSATNRELSQ